MPSLRSKTNILSRLSLLVGVVLSLAGGAALAQTPVTAPLPIPRDAAGKVTPVGDFANVIDDATEQKLANMLKNLADKQGIEYAVVTVNSTNGQEVFDYSLALMRGWGVGSEEKQGQTARPGLLTLIAVNDRKYFTQVSRHLEGDLPDGQVAQIQRVYLVPLLRQGRYSEAVSNTTQAFVGEMARKRGFNVEGLDQKYVRQTPLAPRSSPQSGVGAGRLCLCLIILFIFLIILFIISRKSGGGGGSGWGGGGFGGNGRYANQDRGGGIIPVPIIIGGGWGGGDSGGGGDWGSSDWGGFSGGGGDAGGGGAGGDW